MSHPKAYGKPMKELACLLDGSAIGFGVWNITLPIGWRKYVYQGEVFDVFVSMYVYCYNKWGEDRGGRSTSKMVASRWLCEEGSEEGRPSPMFLNVSVSNLPRRRPPRDGSLRWWLGSP